MKFPIIRVSRIAGLYGNPNLVVRFTDKYTGEVLFTTDPDRYTIGKTYEDLASAYNTKVWRSLYDGHDSKDSKSSKLLDTVIDHAITAGTDLQGSLRDILTDLRLLADMLKLDFAKANEGAEEAHAEEERGS